MNLEHIAINVAEPAAMSAWYVENMGMRIVLAAPSAPFMHFISDEKGSMVELYSNPVAPVPDYASMSPFQFHLSFSTSDIAADHARLLAAGADSVDEISETPMGDKLVFVRDPWGVPVQLVQRNKALI